VFESDLFDPYERLIAIEILGRRVEVPEHNRLLRCFQYLSLETISYGDFCWNGDCTNCQVTLREADQPPAAARRALACRTDAREGMVITRLSPHIRIKGVNE
jgi:NADH dehydrogenase/NADH:ubiquinone oxidoreductase subunit G